VRWNPVGQWFEPQTRMEALNESLPYWRALDKVHVLKTKNESLPYWCALDRVHVGYTFSKALALVPGYSKHIGSIHSLNFVFILLFLLALVYLVGKHAMSLTCSEFLLFPRLRGAVMAPLSAGKIEANVLYIVILCSEYTRTLPFENLSHAAAQSVCAWSF
jgi:hypothetical protein